VHAEGDVWLPAVSAEVALAGEEAEEISRRQVICPPA
jgi:hypothetical protein